MFLAIIIRFFAGQVWSDGFNRALHFPKEASVDNYVMLTPDFSLIKDELSVCSWMKIIDDPSATYPWFSYVIQKSDKTILLRRNSYVFYTTKGKSHFSNDIKFMTNEWYHYCMTWKSGALDVYINGIKIRTTGNAPTGAIIKGGILMLGQEQDNNPGGGFKKNEWFLGEIYNLNVFKKKLSVAEAAGVFYNGTCANIARPLSYDILLSWGDIMKTKRNGSVIVVDAGCDACQRVF